MCHILEAGGVPYLGVGMCHILGVVDVLYFRGG